MYMYNDMKICVSFWKYTLLRLSKPWEVTFRILINIRPNILHVDADVDDDGDARVIAI